MNPETSAHGRGLFEFDFPQIETRVRVEVFEGEVIVRATRDSFTAARKAAFLWELSEEGFIPEGAVAGAHAAGGAYPRVRWLVDPSWIAVPSRSSARALRVVIWLIAAGGAFWVFLMSAALLG